MSAVTQWFGPRPGWSAAVERSTVVTVTSLLAAASLAGCHRPPPAPPAVAIFGADRILAPELAAELERVRIESDGETRLEGSDFAAVRSGVLKDLVDHRLLLGEAVRAGITVSTAELDDALAQRRALAPPGDTPKDGLSPDQLRARLREQILIDRFLLREVAARVAIGPDDAMNYYKAHPDEFRHGEQVRVSQILIPRRDGGDTTAMAQAQALRKEIGRGGDFAKLARQHSDAPEARLGGDLGWFGRGMMPPEFDPVCFGLRKGQISDVVESPYGLHIFKLVDRREASAQPFADVEHGIEQKLQRAAVEKAEAAYLEKLRQKAGVKLIDSEVGKVM